MSTIGGMVPDSVTLGPNDVVSDRPFTAVEKTGYDLEILHSLLTDLRAIAADVEEGALKLEPYQRLAWRVGGLAHRLLIGDFERLRSHPALCVVGFFAERRTEVDIWPLEEANSSIVNEFSKYPGILSYSSVELPDQHWANMVLHDDPVDTEFWRKSELHARAVEMLSPLHYVNVRIHNGKLTSGVFERPSIAIQKTKYFDYSHPTMWRAERSVIDGYRIASGP